MKQKDLAAKLQTYGADINLSSLSLGTYDNIHPSNSGSKMIASKLYKKINKVTTKYK